MFSSIFLTLSINWFIDHVAGHRGYRRAPYTHSFITSTAIALIITFLYIYILGLINLTVSAAIYAASVAIAITHMVLDMMTKDGIYPLWPFSSSRVSILGVRYDNPIANTLFVLISLIIVVLILFDAARFYLYR